ncbi:MAG: hypothetical protein IT306_11660 [Chloroflexi bacterium]|nr:hypothetical protein [Chloroflexota bacterium]
MSESDGQNTISTSAPRLGEIGRAVARNVRSLPDTMGLPSFASSLAEATQARAAAAPGGVAPSVAPAGLGGPASPDEAGPLMLMASAQATGVQAYPTTQPGAPTTQPGAPTTQPGAPTTQPGMPTTQPGAPVGQPASAPITGAGTRKDPLVLPYGASAADIDAAEAALAAARGVTPTAELKPLSLKEYPKPEKSDRNGVLSWTSSTPPTGRELDRFVDEARNRKAGWATFEVDPGNVEQYDELVERLTEAGIQPIARVQDHYGDLLADDVRALVKDLRQQGVRYFELFDGGNVNADTPDDHVDVRDYAERWLVAAQAVVESGGLPGIGALSPSGDYDDRGFMRQVLNAVKERGGTDVLGQSWLALRGATPGKAASTTDVEGLAERAEWFDRISRHALGRSLPILATLDPAGGAERLADDPGSASANNAADKSEQTLKDVRRKLPALFGVNRGTVAPAP